MGKKNLFHVRTWDEWHFAEYTQGMRRKNWMRVMAFGTGMCLVPTADRHTSMSGTGWLNRTAPIIVRHECQPQYLLECATYLVSY